MQKPFNYNQVLTQLIKKFPFVFSRNPRRVVPLGTNTLSEIVRVLGLEGEEVEPYRLALKRYQQSTAYLTAFALGRKRRTLWGEKFPSHILPADRERARATLQQRGAWTRELEIEYRSRIGHFVRLESNSPSRQTHDERYRRWVERLQQAGFSAADIEIIQHRGINTKDLEAARKAIDGIV